MKTSFGRVALFSISCQPVSRLTTRFLSISSSKMASNKVLNFDNLNPNVKTMEYAVRGPLVIRAVDIEKELAQVSMSVIKKKFMVFGGACSLSLNPSLVPAHKRKKFCTSFPPLDIQKIKFFSKLQKVKNSNLGSKISIQNSD